MSADSEALSSSPVPSHFLPPLVPLPVNSRESRDNYLCVCVLVQLLCLVWLCVEGTISCIALWIWWASLRRSVDEFQYPLSMPGSWRAQHLEAGVTA